MMMQQAINGEEAVYSSDGLTPLSIPTAPLTQTEPLVRGGDLHNTEISDEYDISPGVDSRKAFEIFQGKLYKPQDDSDSLRNSRRDSIGRESLLDKLSRLSVEVKELETDLSKIPSTISFNSMQNKNEENGTMATVPIKDTVKDLSSRLAALSGSTMGTSSRSKQKVQKDLTALIKSEVMRISSSTQTQPKPSTAPHTKPPITSSPGKGATSTTSSSPNTQNQNQALQNTGGIIYELYAPVQNPGLSVTTVLPEASTETESVESLDKRLRRIENFVGQGNSVGTQELGNVIHRGTLLQRLMELEQKIHRVDEKTLQLASTRAKVIRADLEAAAKARNKLNTSLLNTGDDPKIIARLYEQLLDIDGLFVSSSSNVLSSIVQRLSTCANLHSHAMTFENRLDELERISKEMTQLVRNVEESLGRVETGMVANMKILEQNMHLLDERAKSFQR